MPCYALIDPRTKATRYVGRSQRPRRRFLQHVKESHSIAVRDWIDELRDNGLAPEFKLLNGGTEREWILLLAPDLNSQCGSATKERPAKTRALTIWLSSEQMEEIQRASGDYSPSTWARAELLKAARAVSVS